ncbi:MAG: hypothetical protein ACUVT7_01370 [Thermoplasmata archaeon]
MTRKYNIDCFGILLALLLMAMAVIVIKPRKVQSKKWHLGPSHAMQS